MKWIFLVILCIFGISLVLFIFIQNLKDKKELEQILNNDYPKKKDEEEDLEIDE